MAEQLDINMLRALLGQVAASPSMRKMAELDQIAKKHGFEISLVEALVPALIKFIIDAQTKDKLGDAAEFVAQVTASASEFGPEMARLLEITVGGTK